MKQSESASDILALLRRRGVDDGAVQSLLAEQIRDRLEQICGDETPGDRLALVAREALESGALDRGRLRRAVVDEALGVGHPLDTLIQHHIAAVDDSQRIPVAAQPATKMLGRYPIVGQLGKGGMGEVLSVLDPDLGREVAAKVIRGTPDRRLLDKFVLEARITGQLEHPAIVPAHELGKTDDGVLFLTMKKVEGVELREVIGRAKKTGAPDLAERLGLFLRMCDGVAFAHSKGILHRDLKPANIMVGQFGEVLVMDWGLAKITGEADVIGESALKPDLSGGPSDELKTLDGDIIGTPTYMPPEQARGEVHELDHRADIYSLGALLYELLTLERPYTGPNAWTVLHQVLDGPPVAPGERAEHGVPWELEGIVLKAMARERDARYASVEALQDDVRRYQAGNLVSVASYRLHQRLWKWMARHKVATGALLAIAITLALGAAGVRYHAAQQVERAWREVDTTEVERLASSSLALAGTIDRGTALRPPPQLRRLDELRKRSRMLLREKTRIDKVLALAPRHAPARTLQFLVLTTVGAIAERTHDEQMAWLVYERARHLAPPDRRAAMVHGLKRAGSAVRRRRKAHEARISELFELALSGKLQYLTRLEGAITELASYREQQTIDLLNAKLELLQRELLASAQSVFRKELRDEALAEEACRALARLSPATRDEGMDVIDKLPERPWGMLIVRAQKAHLIRDGRDRETLLRLVSAALGRIGGTDAARRLSLTIWRDFDEQRAVHVGIALALLAVDDPEAETLLRDITRGGGHFKPGGLFWKRVTREFRALADRTATGQTGDDPIASARSAEERGDIERAIAEYGRAIARFPERSEPHFGRARMRMKRRAPGDAEAALKDIGNAIARDVTNSEAFRQKGQILSALGRLEEALVALHASFRLKPGSEVLNDRGNILRRMGRLDEAIADFTMLLEDDPRSAMAFVNRGMTYYTKGDYDKALIDLDRAIAIDPRDAAAHCNRGLIHGRRAGFDKAIIDYDRAIALDPKLGAAYRNRGELRIVRGDRDGALRDANQAITVEPIAGHYKFRARLFLTLRELKKALLDADAAVRAAPRDDETHAIRATILGRLGDTARALAAYDRAIQLAPEDSGHLRARARFRLAQGDRGGALRDLATAIQLAPKSHAPYLDRADLLARMGHHAQALQDYDRGLALSPDRALPYIHRARLKVEMGDKAGAKTDFDRAIRAEPKLAFARYSRGVWYQQSGQHDAALTDYVASIKLDPRLGPAYVNRGVILMLKGDLDAAIVSLRSAVRIAPQIPFGHTNLGRALAAKGQREAGIAVIRHGLTVVPPKARGVLKKALREIGGR